MGEEHIAIAITGKLGHFRGEGGNADGLPQLLPLPQKERTREGRRKKKKKRLHSHNKEWSRVNLQVSFGTCVRFSARFFTLLIMLQLADTAYGNCLTWLTVAALWKIA